MNAPLPDGIARVPSPAIGHMPFKGHRTCAEWRCAQPINRRDTFDALGDDARSDAENGR
jgi:hypothetical protein